MDRYVNSNKSSNNNNKSNSSDNNKSNNNNNNNNNKRKKRINHFPAADKIQFLSLAIHWFSILYTKT